MPRCHNEKSCALPAAIRQRKTPPDDCAGCHMPKREVQTIAHAVLTNHRIVAQAEEPYPDAAFHMTSPQLPDLVHLTAIPGKRDEAISPLVALAGLRPADDSESGVSRNRYFALAKQLESGNPNNVDVLEALAALSLEQKNEDAAIQYLDRAVKSGSTSPQTYEQTRESTGPRKTISRSSEPARARDQAAAFRRAAVPAPQCQLPLAAQERRSGQRSFDKRFKSFRRIRALRKLMQDAEGETNSANP